MGRQSHDTSAAAPGMRIQRSQSKMSLSASFEALAVYFPCMNSFDEEDGGKMTSGEMSQKQLMACGGTAVLFKQREHREEGARFRIRERIQTDCRENWSRLRDVISIIRMTV